MIKLSRERTPQAITNALRGKNRVNKLLSLLEGKRTNTLQFASGHWTHAKAQLKRESHGKCAYCEASTDAVAHGDVEHFRPKSTYWWLAYCYDNYLFSCQICNQSYKSDNFPIHGKVIDLDPPFPDPFPPALSPEKLAAMAAQFCPDPLVDAEGYPMEKFLKSVTREKAGLLDPYLVDPEPFFKWDADPVLKEVIIKPRNRKVAAKRAFAASDKYLGLNRVELRRLRWETYSVLETYVLLLQSGALSPDLRARVENQIKRMMEASAPFAGMSRYFVRVKWQLNL